MALRKDSLKNTILSVTLAGVIISLPIQGHAALGDRVLSQGIKHSDVKELQSNLKTLGYFTYNDITDYFGAITKQAVLDFQKSNGLEVDGYFGPASYKKMMGLMGSSGPSEQPSPPSGSTIVYNRTLSLGVSGQDVNDLQNALKKLGYLKIDQTTSYFGSMTRQAVLDFQKSNGLEVDGYFGPASVRKINDILSGKTESKPTTPPNNNGNPNNNGLIVYKRVLKLGLSGQDIKDLQDALKKIGYLKIDQTTTYFGEITRQAVLDFQRANGLEVDGYFGPASVNKINDILSGKTEAKPVEPNRGDADRRALTIKIIATAKQYIGVPYLFGGSTPSAFDCSGYTQFVYAKHNISIPRTSTTQANTGIKVSRNNLEIGDLIIFSDTYQAGPSHTGIYLGNDNFIHASSSKGVTISSLNENYYKSHFSYGRRVY